MLNIRPNLFSLKYLYKSFNLIYGQISSRKLVHPKFVYNKWHETSIKLLCGSFVASYYAHKIQKCIAQMCSKNERNLTIKNECILMLKLFYNFKWSFIPAGKSTWINYETRTALLLFAFSAIFRTFRSVSLFVVFISTKQISIFVFSCF